MTQIDGRIVDEFMAGTDVPEIAARYAVPEAYVDRVLEDASSAKRKRWDGSLNNWGNRLAYSVIAGLIINLATGLYAVGTVIAVLLFVITTAIVTAVRR
jgi:hypothetical protein